MTTSATLNVYYDGGASICDGHADLKTLKDRLESQGWRYSYARGSRYIFHRPVGELPDPSF